MTARTPSGRAGRRSAPLLALLLLSLLAVAGPASAATTVTAFGPVVSGDVTRGPPTAPPVTVLGTVLTTITTTTPGAAPKAGAQVAGSIGLDGSTSRLASCRTALCTQNVRGAGTPGLTVGHWAEEVQLSVRQPPRTATASGFAVEVAVHLPLGWLTVFGYLSTGLSRAATGSTIHLQLWVDLLTTVRPPPLTVLVVVTACGTAAACP